MAQTQNPNSQTIDRISKKKIKFKGEEIEGELIINSEGLVSFLLYTKTENGERLTITWDLSSFKIGFEDNLATLQYTIETDDYLAIVPEDWEWKYIVSDEEETEAWKKKLENNTISLDELKEMLKELLDEMPCNSETMCSIVSDIAESVKEKIDMIDYFEIEDAEDD